MSDPVVHEVPYRVRYGDTDKMGVMYYGNYMRLFEIARTEMLRATGIPYAHLEKMGYLLPVLEAHCSYLRPLLYDDAVTVECTYTPELSPVLRIEYRILRSGETLAAGWTRHTFVSEDGFKPVKPPQPFLKAMGLWNNER